MKGVEAKNPSDWLLGSVAEEKNKTTKKSIRWSDKFIVIISAIFSIDNGPVFLLLWGCTLLLLPIYVEGFEDSLSLASWFLQWQYLWSLAGFWSSSWSMSSSFVVCVARKCNLWRIFSGSLDNHQAKRILQKAINCTLYCVSIFHNHPPIRSKNAPISVLTTILFVNPCMRWGMIIMSVMKCIGRLSSFGIRPCTWLLFDFLHNWRSQSEFGDLHLKLLLFLWLTCSLHCCLGISARLKGVSGRALSLLIIMENAVP